MSNKAFFITEEEFSEFLGKTDHYKSLQDKVVRLANPQPGNLVLELGAGVGHTALALAKKCEDAHVIAIENRPEVIKIGKSIAKREGASNIEFKYCDMRGIGDLLKKEKLNPDIVVFLYSFHHIPHPIERKKKVAEDLFALAKPGAKVIIGDSVVPISAEDRDYENRVLEQERLRPRIAYLTVFWEEYLKAREKGKAHKDALKLAKKCATKSKALEELAGKKLAEQDGEYPVTLEELRTIWQEAGFRILLCEEINVIGEAILFCVKDRFFSLPPQNTTCHPLIS